MNKAEDVQVLADYLEQNIKGEPAVKDNKGSRRCNVPQPDPLPERMKKKDIEK